MTGIGSAARSVSLSAALVFMSTLVLVVPGTSAAANPDEAYRDHDGVTKALRQLAGKGGHVRTTDLTVTPGGRKLELLEIWPTGGDSEPGDGTPAVLVVADPLGMSPLATAAALKLAELLAAPGGSELIWYIIPSADPDGAARFFERPLHANGRNGRPIDDDVDGESDEDGADDLDGDGAIRTMLLPHPEGRWLLTEDDPPLLREAEPIKDETGLYKRLTEGRDDDGDGEFNEDGPGGIVPGRNFPHAFEHWTSDGGSWAASETESRAILSFAFDHPEIALVLVFGESNNLAKVPESDKQAEAAGGKYKVPGWMARRTGLDPEKEYPIEDLVALARDFSGRKDLTAEDVISFLGLGAAVNPDRNDLTWWNELSDQYGEFLAEAGLDGPRIDPPASVAGSVEEWAYYQFGVPALAVDFWSVPKAEQDGEEPDGGEADAGDAIPTPDEIEKMDRDTFIALGEEKIAAILKANDAPAHIDAAMVIKALEGGMFTPPKIAEMMRERAEKKEAGGVDPDLKALATFSAEKLDGTGYRDWTPVTLSDGREVLVGGPAPFAYRTPPPAMADSLLDRQLPFLLELPGWLPVIAIGDVELDYRGADVYEITLYVRNDGRIPYPTAQGKRCRRPPPVAMTIDGVEILEGRARQTVAVVPARGAASTRWLIRGKSGTRVTLSAATPSAGGDTKTIVLEREGGLR